MAAQTRRPDAMSASTKPRQPTTVQATHLRAQGGHQGVGRSMGSGRAAASAGLGWGPRAGPGALLGLLQAPWDFPHARKE